MMFFWPILQEKTALLIIVLIAICESQYEIQKKKKKYHYFIVLQEGFMTSAQVYAQITELARRVQEWEEKIIPRLREEVSPYFLLQVVMYS